MFYASLGKRAADPQWPELTGLLDEFRDNFDAHMARFGRRPAASEKSRALNTLRAEILAHTRASAAKKPGFFTLTVPTGGGKTLASLGFALDHANHHGHNRIIFAIPFAEAWIETVGSTHY
ncbi:hypothetical protein EPK99_05470 [Neorhizobium lilium]|uniref:Uncharacterized protein n=1 Tax=Neorhizobium lilium TaxID=2503024 RepID=A0A3S3VTS8_9HYPH|nr:hypothetical protein [Neorhizobium lilium]RWX81706.1 hypothetical protein EPK99_05470 [Neorhizobium lilium]